MYAALWRALPGLWPLKLILTVLLLAVVLYCLYAFAFPWAAAYFTPDDVGLTPLPTP